MKTKLLRKVRKRFAWHRFQDLKNQICYYILDKSEHTIIWFDFDTACEINGYTEESKKDINIDRETFMHRMLMNYILKPYGYKYPDMVYNRLLRTIDRGHVSSKSIIEWKKSISKN